MAIERTGQGLKYAMGRLRIFASPKATMTHVHKFVEEVEVDSLDEPHSEPQSEGQPIIHPLSVTNGTAPGNMEAQTVSTNTTSKGNDTENRQLCVHPESSSDSSNGTGIVDNQLDVGESMLLLKQLGADDECCLLYTSPSPRDQRGSRMPSSA